MVEEFPLIRGVPQFLFAAPTKVEVKREEPPLFTFSPPIKVVPLTIEEVIEETPSAAKIPEPFVPLRLRPIKVNNRDLPKEYQSDQRCFLAPGAFHLRVDHFCLPGRQKHNFLYRDV